jgi:transglutaminase-like putative cysteine protease
LRSFAEETISKVSSVPPKAGWPMVRTALLALLPALLIATGWQRLEEPARGGDFALAATLAIVTALITRRWLRVVVGVAAFVAVGAAAFDLSPWDARLFDRDRDFLGPLLSRFGSGVADFYEFALPFDPAERVRMHGVIVLAVFAFTLVAALAIAARRPILAAAATFAGAAWPVALVPDAASTVRGALLLAAALILLAALRPHSRADRQTFLVGAGVAVAALVAVSSPSIAKGAFLDWQNWEPYKRDAKAVSVQYVWDADYDGIEFPTKPTTVLRIAAPRRVPYWRATTLDVFLDDVWQEDALQFDPGRVVRVDDRDALINDPYLPPAASEPENWLPQEVTVEALQDSHLVAASVPVAYEAGAAGGYGSGVAYVGRLRRGQDYQAWSYAVEPTPEQLARSRPNYSFELFSSPFLSVGTPVPPFGQRNREQVLRSYFREDDDLARYEPLYELAKEVVGRPPNPYAAVVAVEAWFRTSDEFTYDETPPVGSEPPLVAFATGHKRGYCQHFAGAMALMLRYLGIPARVAAGFTTGRFDADAGVWTVADTNAHTWVEVWFEGYGWLPFDPTPGRGRLRAEYTASSLFFDADGATAAFAGVGVAALGLTVLRDRLGGGSVSPDDRTGLDPLSGRDPVGGTNVTTVERDNDVQVLAILLLSAGGIVAALWLAKTVRRRLRYLTKDPRRIAGAVRDELVDYVADQGLELASSTTPAELGAAVHERLRVDADRLVGSLAAARFGPASEAESEARTARRELRRVLRTLRRRLPARARFRGLLSLRSLRLRTAWR